MNRVTKLGLLLIAVGWYFNDPVPPGFSEPWKLRWDMARTKVTYKAMQIVDYLGIYPMVDAWRKVWSTKDMAESDIPSHMSVKDALFDDVVVRLYVPKAQAKQAGGRSALVYYHGGGWTIASPRSFDRQMLLISEQLDILVISVEYRMSPEFKFPIPFEDCLVATKYVLSNARDLGIDPSRVAVGGDSAGGNLAAAISLHLRDENFTPQPKVQVLIYPALQAMDFSLPSYRQNKNGPILTAQAMIWFWSNYLAGSSKYEMTLLKNDHTSPEAKIRINNNYVRHEDLPSDYKYEPYEKPNLDHGSPEIWAKLRGVLENPYFAPLMADDLSDLPEAFVFTVHHDVLRDDGLLYVRRLREAGVEVTHVHSKFAYHPVFEFTHVYKEGVDLIQDVIGFLKATICNK